MKLIFSFLLLFVFLVEDRWTEIARGGETAIAIEIAAGWTVTAAIAT